MPAVVQAQFTFTTNHDQITITGYDYTYGNVVVVPASTNGYPVTSLGNNAFFELGVTSVTLPGSITNIGQSAFYECLDLTSVNIPNGVLAIGAQAFDNCTALTSLTLGSGVVSIGDYAFNDCTALSSLTAGNNIASIGNYAFEATALKKITIPNGVVNLGDQVFYNCSSLTNIVIGNNVTNIGSLAFYDCSKLTGVTLPNSVTSIGEEAFEYCSDLTSVVIGYSVTSIGGSAFYFDNNLTSIVLPSSLTSVGNSAFEWCSDLTSAYFLGNAPANDGSAFLNSPNVTVYYVPGTSGWGSTYANVPTAEGTTPASDFLCTTNNGLITIVRYTGTNLVVIIPGSINGYSVSAIGSQAFFGPHTTSVTIPGSVTSIGVEAFSDETALASITIPDSVTNVGDEAFEFCYYLASVSIGNNVTTLGTNVFYDCVNLPSVAIPASLTNIGTGTFSLCTDLMNISVAPGNPAYSSTNGVLFDKAEHTLLLYPLATPGSAYTIPGGVTTVAGHAFNGCTNLSNVTFPASITSIGTFAFASCGNLTSVILPGSSMNFGDYAFFLCTNLTSVYFAGNGPFDDGTVFFDDPATVYYAGNSTGWGLSFGSAPALAETSPSNFLYVTNNNAISITGYTGSGGPLVIPALINGYAVTNIEANAFFGASLTSAIIPITVTSIGGGPFADCASLTNISLAIPNTAFMITNKVLFDITRDTLIQYPDGLMGSTYTIPNTVTSIGDSAFAYCSHLTGVTIPNNVTSLGVDAFYGCTGLTGITIPDSVTSIEDGDFTACYDLASVTIGNNVTSIGQQAFYDCGGLTSITIPNSVTNIENLAFEYCTGLTNLTFGDGIISIAPYAFENCTGLASITVPANITSVGAGAFLNCPALTDAFFQGNVPSDGGSIFSGDPATVYYLQGTTGWAATFGSAPTVEESSPNDFLYSTNDASLTITGYIGTNDVLFLPANVNGYPVTSIGQSAFERNFNLTSVTIPDGVTNIDVAAFYWSSVTNVTIPDSVTSIGDDAFGLCFSMPGITIPGNVTSIGDYAFQYSGLTNIVIPAGVTNIGQQAFDVCNNLTNITVAGANPDYSSLNGVLFDKNKDLLIQYPIGLTDTTYTIPNSVADIGIDAFDNSSSLTSVTIPASVTNISPQAFQSCIVLASVVIPNSVTSIGSGAFDGADLTSVTIPESVTNIGVEAFAYGANLTTAYFMGNEPAGDSSIFLGDNAGIVYYRPGTVGWGSTFGGWPTMSWSQQPVILGHGNGLGATPGGFSFNIAWNTNLNVSVVVQACTNLSNPVWTPVATNILLNGTNYFNDPGLTNHPRRFYRISSQ
ncbi:MAG TPA: leucine-rich repeat domain-containing protein [Verrucomicrobiae bacterium]